MNEGLISKRYAKALFDHAYDLGEETLLYHRMQILESIWQRMPDLKNSLKSPMITVETKKNLLKNVTGKNAEQSWMDFIDLIVTNHRTDAIYMIALSYQLIYRKRKRISVVHLISAKKMSTMALDRMRRFTEQKTHGKVEFSNHIDPSLVGGFIYQLDDLQIDASVKGQLKLISRRLAQINKSIM